MDDNENSRSFTPEEMRKVHYVVKRKWDLLRADLLRGVFDYKDTIRAKQNSFLSEFDKLFNEGGNKFLVASIDQVFSKYIAIRGAVIKPSEPLPTIERFIPKSMFIKEDNRFSPAGIEWLYLTLGYPNDENGKKNAITCAQKECRAHIGDRFAICEFSLREKDARVIDLTIGENWTPKKQQEEMRSFIVSRQRNGKVLDADLIEKSSTFQRFVVNAYSNILSEELFVPLKTNSKQIEYAPFHCIATYFQSYGYNGIIYKSTIYDGGKNIVLFNKHMAMPIAPSIEEYIII